MSHLQAEGYQANEYLCAFTREQDFGNAEALNRTQGRLHQVGHTARRFTGYMLVCSDPGPEYMFFAFTTGNLVLKVRRLASGIGIVRLLHRAAIVDTAQQYCFCWAHQP